MERFILQPSELQPGKWVCTDTVNLLVCTFGNKNYNDDQEFTVLKDFDPINANELARFAREMGDWLRSNHYDKIF
ncbi:MAG: hypothetical protein QM800_12760 [Paludibacter sp.]